MKKAIPILLIFSLFLIYFLSTGFCKRSDVILVDYSVSNDGTSLELTAGIPTSMGYIRGGQVRGFKNSGGGIKSHYLTFYSTFGGLNSSFGAKNVFTLELTEDTTEIYFNRPNGGYELVLIKNTKTGQWNIP